MRAVSIKPSCPALLRTLRTGLGRARAFCSGFILASSMTAFSVPALTSEAALCTIDAARPQRRRRYVRKFHVTGLEILQDGLQYATVPERADCVHVRRRTRQWRDDPCRTIVYPTIN